MSPAPLGVRRHCTHWQTDLLCFCGRGTHPDMYIRIGLSVWMCVGAPMSAGAGGRGRGRNTVDPIMHKTVKIIQGPYKGYFGMVKVRGGARDNAANAGLLTYLCVLVCVGCGRPDGTRGAARSVACGGDGTVQACHCQVCTPPPLVHCV